MSTRICTDLNFLILFWLQTPCSHPLAHCTPFFDVSVCRTICEVDWIMERPLLNSKLFIHLASSFLAKRFSVVLDSKLLFQCWHLLLLQIRNWRRVGRIAWMVEVDVSNNFGKPNRVISSICYTYGYLLHFVTQWLFLVIIFEFTVTPRNSTIMDIIF